MRRSGTLEKVLRGQLCTGCGLCAAVSDGAIEMSMAPPGYARPTQITSLSPAAEAAIAQSCPGAVVEPWSQSTNAHPYWGPWRDISVGHAANPRVRYAGSSGGALSALLIHALQTGLVDRVLHITADPERPTQNITIYSRTPEEVVAGSGSRYTASSPLANLDDALAEGGAMAFVGKPCDVSALRRLAKLDPRVDRHVPLVLSFFCGGMPSHDGVARILAAMGVEPSNLVSFRYRGNGWPGRAVATTRDGQTAEMSYADSWGGYLSKEVQFRCKICSDAVGGTADIACADAWYGGESGYPQFDERDGRSLIVARTEVGQRLLEDARRSSILETEALDIAQIDLMQPSQARRKRLAIARLAALVVSGQPKPLMRGTMLPEAFASASFAEAARNFVGTLRRIVVGRR